MSIKYSALFCGIVFLLSSCVQESHKQRHQVELLNQRAFNLRYTSPDSVQSFANQALKLSDGYSAGLAESYNNLGLASYMLQDFKVAEEYYGLATKSTGNQIERLISDIGMLKVCSRASDNKRFYDYEAKIRKRLKLLRNEMDVLDEHELTRLIFAESDFHLSASIYYYYMQQNQKAQEELLLIDGPSLAAADSIQWSYYEYMKCAVELMDGSTYEEEVKQEFDTLLRLLFFAREKGLIYIEANILEAFVEKLSDPHWAQIVYQTRYGEFSFVNPSAPSDSLFRESLSVQALDTFRKYGDDYQIAGARRGLAEVLFYQGDYKRALEQLTLALEDINHHYRKYNRHADPRQVLTPYNPQDTAYVDMAWMVDPSVSTVPQWIANIRQLLSLVYSALDNKPASDYNRNIYLDLLEITRQDKEMESRLEQLDITANHLNWLFVGTVLFAVVGLILLLWLNRKWRKRNAERIEKLSITAELCNYISTAIPTDVADSEDLRERLEKDIQPKLADLFPSPITLTYHEDTDTLSLSSGEPLPNDERNLLSLIEPYLNWAYQYGSHFLNLDEEYRKMEKERFLHEQHIAENKRQNLDKRTCMSIVTGITPFLDRVLNEINKLNQPEQTDSQKRQRYIYIQELIDRINEYNDIMALWIKMKQGALSLHVETFSLQDLFETIQKGKRSFENKGQQLSVEHTDAVLKADKALTLFMINTLCDNARKYTPEGGTVKVYAQNTPDYVEISVKDTGVGLSEEDRRVILEEKVYDSSKIGLHQDASDNVLRQNKGYGFGLMNCKGIIDKYRKTNPIFSVCRFDIESEPGKGCRFFFRLPKGILRMMVGFVLLLSGLTVHAQEQEIMKATAFADSTYYCNIDGYYQEAMDFADSAFYYLNKHYQRQHPQSRNLLSVRNGSPLAELDWWEKDVTTDYHLILDIRNEAAVAALALKLWDIYQLNNEGYTRLYKLVSEDNTLKEFCQQMETSASNRMAALVVLLILILVFILILYSLFVRQSLMFRINVQQVMEVNEKILNSFSETKERDLTDLLHRMLMCILPDLNAIHSHQALSVCIRDAENQLHWATASLEGSSVSVSPEKYKQVIENGIEMTENDGRVQIYPLSVTQNHETECVGALAFVTDQVSSDKNERLIRELIIRYMSIVIYQTIIRLSNKQIELEVAEDEKRRAIHEENLLHVQNMMLDNCLSTLKHETMYYPNRIRQIVEKLQGENDTQKEAEQTIAMQELITYYKEIFTVLSECANRQLEHVKFTRRRLPVQTLGNQLEKYFNKIVRKHQLDWTLSLELSSRQVLGDVHLLRFLMESLVDSALGKNDGQAARFTFTSRQMDGFERFDFTDSRGTYTQQELNQIFYPDLQRMEPDDSGRLSGIEYLTMRQIIRDHDELCRHRGCRINAEPLEDGGYLIWFTIPLSELK